MPASISYDVFTEAFLAKISEFDLVALDENIATNIVDGYMRRAIATFKKICKYPLTEGADDLSRTIVADIASVDLDEIVDIVSDGMVVQWLKPYLNQQENLQNVLNSRDWSAYSPATLQQQVRQTYEKAQKDFIQGIREYSYNHGDLTSLHI